MYQVILVDDEALIREAICDRMDWAGLGYELAGCMENGQEALEFIRKHPVDVVLTDICMPYMDGLELCEYLVHEFPKIKIIIISGYDEFGYAKRALQYNVTEYILKPVTSTELSKYLISIKENLDQRRKQEKKIDEISAAYHKNKLLIRSNVLRNLLEGNRTWAESEKELLTMGICLAAEAFRVAIVSIDLFEQPLALDEKTKQESALTSFMVYNITSEIVSKHQAGEVCQGEGFKTLILFETNKPHEFAGMVSSITLEIVEVIRKLTELEVSITIGKYVSKLSDVYKSYKDACQASGLLYCAESPVIDMEQRKNIPTEIFDMEQELETLVLYMRIGEREEVNKALEAMKRHMCQALPEKRKAMLSLHKVVNQMSELLKVANLEDQPLYLEKEGILNQIASLPRLKDVFGILSDYCLKIMKQLEIGKNHGGKKYALLALDYIEKNYANQELSLNTICTYLNISTSRFSAIFKGVTGETFMEILIRTRMEKAKELLKNTDMKNYQIAERVGFSDPHYFSISFKKCTGMSPKEYAKNAEERGRELIH